MGWSVICDCYIPLSYSLVFQYIQMPYKGQNKNDELIIPNPHFLENDKSTVNPTHRYIIVPNGSNELRT